MPFQVEAAATALPKKANWDLKRDIEALMARLDRQTQRAIAEIVREKVRAQQSSVSSQLTPSEVQRYAAGATGASSTQQHASDDKDKDSQFDFSAAGIDPAALVRAVAGVEAAIGAEVSAELEEESLPRKGKPVPETRG